MHLDRRLLIVGGASTLSATLGAGVALARQHSAPSLACNQPVFKELIASGPRIDPAEPPDARLFDRIAGAWDVDYTDIRDDGSRDKIRGQLLAGWVLDGRALQDVWLQFPKPGEDRFIGTTIRFYDADRNKWRVTWVSAIAKAMMLLEGGAEDGGIALYNDGPRGRTRWTFSHLTDKGFTWRGELSTDGGKTWRLREDHRMYRAAG
jgi:hypothetical protein